MVMVAVFRIGLFRFAAVIRPRGISDIERGQVVRILKILNREEISARCVSGKRFVAGNIAGKLAVVVHALTCGCADDDVIQRQTRASLDIARDIQVRRQQRQFSVCYRKITLRFPCEAL